jgi:hypothetical protein
MARLLFSQRPKRLLAVVRGSNWRFHWRWLTSDIARKPWKPRTLRPSVLVVTILLCWSLIALLQIFLFRSQRDGGLIFAPRISDLPLSRTFLFFYLPTVVAVLFSMHWAWIDLDAKRLEPYYQLNKKDGALGKDSLLLQYPFDLNPFVPVKALRAR